MLFMRLLTRVRVSAVLGRGLALSSALTCLVLFSQPSHLALISFAVTVQQLVTAYGLLPDAPCRVL